MVHSGGHEPLGAAHRHGCVLRLLRAADPADAQRTPSAGGGSNGPRRGRRRQLRGTQVRGALGDADAPGGAPGGVEGGASGAAQAGLRGGVAAGVRGNRQARGRGGAAVHRRGVHGAGGLGRGEPGGCGTVVERAARSHQGGDGLAQLDRGRSGKAIRKDRFGSGKAGRGVRHPARPAARDFAPDAGQRVVGCGPGD